MSQPTSLIRAMGTAVALTFLAAGCGVIKNREDKVVVAREVPDQTGRSGPRSGDPEEEAIRQIKEFLDLYTQNGEMTREGLANFIERYKDRIGPFLEGMHLTSQELIDLIFKFDADQDGRVTPREISAGLMKRLPVLRWIPDNQTAIGLPELTSRIASEFPRGSAAAHSGLASALMRFDRTWAQGNGDGLITRAELSGAGLVLAVLAQTDFDNGFQLPPGIAPPFDGIDLGPVVARLVQQKIDQQLMGRYPFRSSSGLSPADLRLEWMQVILRFFAADKLVHAFAPTSGEHAGRLPADQVERAIAAWIPGSRAANAEALREAYDGSAMGGNVDGHLSSIEAFNLLSDLDFARDVRSVTGGDFSVKAMEANPRSEDLIRTLETLFPRSGTGLYRYGREIRYAYWERFSQFDRKYQGGDGDGRIDDGETAMGLAYSRIIENLYELFDANHDGYLARSEGNRLFAALGIRDYRIIDAFYANVGLNNETPTFWQKLKIFFGGDQGWKYLASFDFHVRIVQVYPRLRDKERE